MDRQSDSSQAGPALSGIIFLWFGKATAGRARFSWNRRCHRAACASTLLPGTEKRPSRL